MLIYLLAVSSCVLLFRCSFFTVNSLAGPSCSHSTVICSPDGLLRCCQPPLVCCCFIPAEQSGVSLKNVTYAGKNGAINEGFEIEVGVGVEHISLRRGGNVLLLFKMNAFTLPGRCFLSQQRGK